ncbi:hypothetical protein F3N42_04620 [Marinihelvus fidelis]|uniref:Uncharacterized protein n=1 Tax=Marinihelvus fidelis TaxID=2613842 RepID=A0A5N0TBX1_9GAMM|nr:hypothetical protein [Marinihelvus fidelis]KAA9132512.1 hypothetical protein F3N42_04620 [Marinihelvus fidelis]
MIKHALAAIAPALALLAVTTAATTQDDAPKPAKIFTTDNVLAVTIKGPWRTIGRNKNSGEEWQGEFSYSADGATVTLPVSLRARGLTRLDVCDFPPLRIGFDKQASKGTTFRGAGNLKLVTHCLKQEKYQAYPVKEYLAYRIYNQVTELSYRVQGMDIRYIDTETGRETERFGFLIEDPDDVAKRNGLLKLDIEGTIPPALDADETSLFMVFQYLISNLDWSVLGGPDEYCCHNARLAGKAIDERPVYALPYDFDSSGFVDAHYASPPDGLRVRNLRQRLFRGFCMHNDAVPGAVQAIREQREAIMAMVNNEPRLDGRSMDSAVRFLDSFFERVDSADGIASLTDSCRG